MNRIWIGKSADTRGENEPSHSSVNWSRTVRIALRNLRHFSHFSVLDGGTIFTVVTRSLCHAAISPLTNKWVPIGKVAASFSPHLEYSRYVNCVNLPMRNGRMESAYRRTLTRRRSHCRRRFPHVTSVRMRPLVHRQRRMQRCKGRREWQR